MKNIERNPSSLLLSSWGLTGKSHDRVNNAVARSDSESWIKLSLWHSSYFKTIPFLSSGDLFAGSRRRQPRRSLTAMRMINPIVIMRMDPATKSRGEKAARDAKFMSQAIKSAKAEDDKVPKQYNKETKGNDKRAKEGPKKQRPLILSFLYTLLLLLPLYAGCRGYSTENPPIHVNPNMDTQEKGRAYRASDTFDDGHYMRDPIEGTISVGHLKEDEHFYFGKVNGEPAKSFPPQVSLDEAFAKRGQVIFNRVCAACHAAIGDGNGLVGFRLLVKPASLHSERMYGMPPGYFFNVIHDGMGTMQSYKHMLSPQDIWAAVSYVRILQMSQDMDGDWIERSASWWKTR